MSYSKIYYTGNSGGVTSQPSPAPTGVSIVMTVYLLSDVTLLLRNLTFAVATHVGNQSLPLCGALAHSALMGGVFSHHHVVNKRKRCEKIRRLLGFASSLEQEVRAINSGLALRGTAIHLQLNTGRITVGVPLSLVHATAYIQTR